MERGRRRLPPRRPRITVVLDFHRQTGAQVSDAKVCSSGGLEEEDGKEDEDDEWKFVGDCGHRPTPDPTEDLRPIGSKSRFWALADDDDSDEEVASQSPYTPDLECHAAVHGFTKDQLIEAELALRDSLIHRRVEQPMSSASTDLKVKFV